MFQDGQVVYFINIEHIGPHEFPRLHYGRIVETNITAESGKKPKVFYSLNEETRWMGMMLYENIPEEQVYLSKVKAERRINELKI
jgi:hypothetical protein